MKMWSGSMLALFGERCGKAGGGAAEASGTLSADKTGAAKDAAMPADRLWTKFRRDNSDFRVMTYSSE
jgi:hypothetical protein